MEREREDRDLDSSTRYIKDAATARGIHFESLLFYQDEVSHEIYELSLGKKVHRLDITSPDLTSSIANTIADNKFLTHQLLDKLNVPSLRYGMFHRLDDALAYFDKQNVPLVIKPIHGGGGDGVCIDIRDRDEFIECFNYSQQFCPYLLVEDFCPGKDTRFLVVGGRLAAIARREPAFVVGDGKSNLGGLIDKVNEQRQEGRKGYLSKIRIDKIAKDYLKKQNRALSDVIAQDEKVYVRPNANLNTGGTSKSIDFKDIHPDNIHIVEQVAVAVGLSVAGIDVMCIDPSRPFTETGGVILEVNDRPRIRMHQQPYLGEPVSVADKIIDMLFPETKEQE